ncbi:hypothetical protein [Rhizobium leguminosarum]|uniref:hypothetical protein n=1 Tax=Rhizobium leguminosarum TaxID=384 RepID=UPI001C980A4C|nr:hypothetical protein [Rhizobium leguminosarum]MBY5524329.1 hypothetical protein [Rhizobium leguminosarum]MBY5643742.1 hypothetical protein [Rhizobium leguminosarum]
MAKRSVLLTVITVVNLLLAAPSQGDQLRLQIPQGVDGPLSDKNFLTGFPGSGSTTFYPLKYDADALAKVIVDLGGATDEKTLSRTLDTMLNRPRYTPDLVGTPAIGGTYVQPGTILPYLRMPKPLTLASDVIGIMNQTPVTFAFRLSHSDGSSKNQTLSTGEFRTYDCVSDCQKGFKALFSTGKNGANREIEVKGGVVYRVFQRIDEWTISETKPSDWNVSYQEQ